MSLFGLGRVSEKDLDKKGEYHGRKLAKVSPEGDIVYKRS